MPWALLAAGCLAMFAASSSGATRAPFLIDMARDLGTSVPLVANIMASVSIAWGAASLIAGAWSDRWGRRPFLIGGPVALAVCVAGVAASPGFVGVMLWATAAGGCAGAYTGIVMAEASARTVDRQRGRALGWIMSGQSLALLVGVPAGAWIGSVIGWRGVNLCVGAVALLAALGLFLATLRPAGRGGASSQGRTDYRAALAGPVLRLLFMGVAERSCFGLTAIYFATFLQQSYGLGVAAIAAPLALFALGNILGTVLGGQLADRLPDRRRTFACAMLASAVIALLLFGWTGHLGRSVALGFAYVLVVAVARPSLMATLANVPDAVRGTVLGMNVAAASAGWIAAAAVGGWMMAAWGFAAFGPFAALLALIGAALALTGRR